MQYKMRILIIAFISISTIVSAQNKPDSISNSAICWKKIIVPLALISYGTYETIIEKNGSENVFINDLVTKHVVTTTTADDYLQYVPSATVYALNLLHVKGKNRFKDRTLALGLSFLLMGVTVNTLKYTSKIRRPDHSSYSAFPSGHTATAFMGAEFLHQEFKHVSPWIGIAGYAVATTTGILRMYNSKHWLGDVCAGAGIGILSTKIAYTALPWLKRKFTKHKTIASCITVMPYFDGVNYGTSVFVRL